MELNKRWNNVRRRTDTTDKPKGTRETGNNKITTKRDKTKQRDKTATKKRDIPKSIPQKNQAVQFASFRMILK